MENSTQTCFVQTGSYQTLVNESGGEHDTTILLLHGSGPGANAMSNWQFALPFLGDNYHCLAPDIAGFGQSQHVRPPQGTDAWIDAWVDQMISLLDARNLEKVYLVGNSMGGGVALQLLARHPERFEKTVLMGAVGAPFKATEGLQKGWGFYESPSEAALAELVGKFLHNPALLGGDIQKIAAERYKNVMQDNVRLQFEAMFSKNTQESVDAFVLSEQQLKSISQPLLITHGREDYFIPLSNSYYLAERIPNAQLHVFHHCGHWIQIEQRTAFNNLIKLFFDGVLD